jgi:4-amino-4-deoxy-L-arabinose transferase-like glycosyltransferase
VDDNVLTASMEMTPEPRRGSGLLGAVVLVAAVASVLAWMRLSDIPDLDRGDQKKTAQYLLHAWNEGQWLLPREQGYILPTKPPFFVWTALAAAKSLGGPTDLALRLPSAIAGVLIAVLTVLTGNLLRNRRAGLVAGLAVCTQYLWFRLAGWGRPDMVLCLCVTVAIWSFVRLRVLHEDHLIDRFLFWGALAAGTLTKGPVALVLPLLTITLVLGWRRGLRGFRRLKPVVGGLTCLVLILLWFVPALQSGGRELWDILVLDETLNRIADPAARGAVAHPAHRFLAEVAGRSLPWVLLLPAALWAAVPSLRGAREPGAPRSGPTVPVAWLAAGLIVFLLPAQKRSDYAMAFVPAGALLIGMLMADLRTLPKAPRWLALGGLVPLVLLAFASVLTVLDAVGKSPSLSPKVLDEAERAFIGDHSAAVITGVAVAAIAATGALVAFMHRNGLATALCLVALFACGAAGHRWVLDSEDRDRAAARRDALLAVAQRADAEGVPLHTYSKSRQRIPFNSTVAFYLGLSQPPLRTVEQARTAAQETGRVWLVTGQRATAELTASGAAKLVEPLPGPPQLRLLEVHP